jgi:Uma2 family endonuclease
MATIDQITTAEQLLLNASRLGRCELVRGELIERPYAGCEEGIIAAHIASTLGELVHRCQLGAVVLAAGFQIARDPDTVRAPDVAFVCAQRVPPRIPRGYFEGAPDLAVEVLSPQDRASEVMAKVQDWLGAGCREVWVIDPRTETVSVCRSRNESLVLHAADRLTIDQLLPGFSLNVAEIFAT